MIIGKRLCLALLCYLAVSVNAWAEYYDIVTVDNYDIQFKKEEEHGIELELTNNTSGQKSKCKIENWSYPYYPGWGLISVTSDKVGLLIYESNKYIKLDELLECNNKLILLHDTPFADKNPGTVVDVNFAKKIFLSLVLIDTRTSTYQAVVSYFNSGKNIFSGKWFWDDSVKEVHDGGFYVRPDYSYSGKISPDGKYVAPDGMYCFNGDFTGVWDIEKKKRVVLTSDNGEADFKDKCDRLFYGKATLEELHGKLVTP